LVLNYSNVAGVNNNLGDSMSRIDNKSHFLYVMQYFENHHNRWAVDSIRNLFRSGFSKSISG
jgi:hypothetical protein